MKRLLACLPRSRLFQQSGVLFLGQVGASIPAYLFSVLVARLLGPADFGTLAVSVTLVQILGRASGPLLWVMTNVAATFIASGEPGKLRYFVTWTLRRLVALTLVTLAPVMLLYLLGNWLRLPSAVLVILTWFWFAAQLMLLLARGVQQGLQWFSAVAFNLTLEAVLRLCIGLALIYAGWQVNGALVGYGMGSALAALLAFILIYRRLPHPPPDTHVQVRSLYRFSAQAAAAAWCFAVLSNVDFIAVKHFLSATDAGLYAAIQLFGLIALMVFSALYTVMFSAVSSSHARGDAMVFLFRRVLLLVIGLGIAAVALCAMLAKPLIVYTVGAQYAQAAPFLVWYMTATVLLSLVMVINLFYLARREGHFIPPLVLGTILLVGLLLVYHSRVEAVLLDINLAYGLTVLAYVAQSVRLGRYAR